MANPPHTVLVVDDDDIIRRLIERLLSLSGHTALAAASGQQALALLATHPIDLAIVDLMMPEMSGVEVLRRIKADPALCNLPVIVVSADSDSDNIATCLSLGADDYLTKPFNTRFFNARVGASLARRQCQAQEQADRLALEAQLRRQTVITQAILAGVGAGVMVVDSAGRLVQHNSAASELLGDAFGSLIPHPAASGAPLYLPDQITACLPGLLPLACALQGHVVDGMTLFVAPSGDRPGRWLSITARPISDPDGVPGGGVAIICGIHLAGAQVGGASY